MNRDEIQAEIKVCKRLIEQDTTRIKELEAELQSQEIGYQYLIKTFNIKAEEMLEWGKKGCGSYVKCIDGSLYMSSNDHQCWPYAPVGPVEYSISGSEPMITRKRWRE